ncbi:tRNA-binding protein [Granulibacter bethesdensis]|uniref:Protein secretion chaperonin CsaA n=3 Tax=Granulibacter bethesdensis TaxID=364410 RepID=Q0BUZ3_GRABC|nr:tRNA-binding protein [Granulibacter bethesdensis]ABI61359.1 Protein secretion chaperonin CsaA [Granulibacter bethesdensis CGDNIH1]APG30436.1 Protein secretion chaperonin CsaA [Granulibacter bethesdensis]APG30594.1 Protein secretion chaperonin CsaA [Granulibacter bethesdensis]APH51148.1 Protein secretion chaperonin CsaA [Granulibacter bethesdensis]APH63842.1 Protein secretion chaperonin CsaA [Granulibacter bethesdensis]
MMSCYPDTISWDDFEKIDLRVGIIRSVERNEKARKPAYLLKIDLGDRGEKISSAQITDKYTQDDLIGMQVLCVCNLRPKLVAGVKSEVLVTGIYDDQHHVVLATFNHALKPGSRLR